jgi:hypothetical protein
MELYKVHTRGFTKIPTEHHEEQITSCYIASLLSLTLKEERRLRVFENRVLRRVFGPKGDEVTGESSKPHNEELHDLYSSLTTVRVIKSRMRWGGHVACMRKGGACTGF